MKSNYVPPAMTASDLQQPCEYVEWAQGTPLAQLSKVLHPSTSAPHTQRHGNDKRLQAELPKSACLEPSQGFCSYTATS